MKMRGKTVNRISTMILYASVIAFLSFFCLLPILSVIESGLMDGVNFRTDIFIETVSSERTRDVVSFTLWQAVISTMATVALALPGAYLMTRYRFKGRSAVMSATTVPFVLPPLVLAIGFVSLFGTNGTLNSVLDTAGSTLGIGMPDIDILYSREVIILAHVFFNFPIALRILASRFETFDVRLIDASRSLGAGPLKTFFRIILPQLRYALLSASSLVFTFCFLSFGVVLVVGGMSNATVEVEIFRYRFDHGISGTLLLIEGLIVLASTSLYLWSSRKMGAGAGTSLGTGFVGKAGKKITPLALAVIILYVALTTVIIFGPLTSVVHTSFVHEFGGETEYSTFWFERLLSRENDPTIGVSPMGAVLNSLLFGLLTIAVSLPLSMVTAYLLHRKGFKWKLPLDTLLLIPIGVSTVGLGYGLVKFYSGSFLDITGSWIIIVMVHSLLAYPLGARSIYTSLSDMPPNLRNAARSLGAGPVKRFLTVDIPLIMPGILVAAVFAFAVSIGEFGATYLVSAPEYTTMPVALYRLLSAGRDIGSATAYGVILMAITFLSFMAIESGIRRIWKTGVRS
ncbi:MAG: ABC transporter permease [Thermoplasmatota archaeon]